MKHYQKSSLRLLRVSNYFVSNNLDIFCVPYLSTIYLSNAKEKSRHKLLRFSYLKETDFRRDKFRGFA